MNHSVASRHDFSFWLYRFVVVSRDARHHLTEVVDAGGREVQLQNHFHRNDGSCWFEVWTFQVPLAESPDWIVWLSSRTKLINMMPHCYSDKKRLAATGAVKYQWRNLIGLLQVCTTGSFWSVFQWPKSSELFYFLPLGSLKKHNPLDYLGNKICNV